MLKFVLTKEIDGSRDVVEVWDGEDFIAGIYPHEDHITVVSKYLENAELDEKLPPKAIISFNRININE